MKQSKEKQTQASTTSHKHVQHSKKVQMWFLKQALIFIWFQLEHKKRTPQRQAVLRTQEREQHPNSHFVPLRPELGETFFPSKFAFIRF